MQVPEGSEVEVSRALNVPSTWDLTQLMRLRESAIASSK